MNKNSIKRTNRLRISVLSSALPLAILASQQALAFSVPVHSEITKEQLQTIRGYADNGSVFQWSEVSLRNIAHENGRVDDGASAALFRPDRHFTNESFPAATARLIDLRTRTIEYARAYGAADSGQISGNSRQIQALLGQALHTIQDFYSHSTWVELGNSNINSALGLSALSKPSASVASCPGDPNLVGAGAGGSPSSAYFVGLGLRNTIGCQLAELPANKCFHGNYRPTCIGINKDLSAADAAHEGVSQHPQHGNARALAEEATLAYVQGIVDELGGDFHALRAFFGAKPSFTAVIDNTGSMGASITGTRQLVSSMVNQLTMDEDSAPLSYVLVQYGDPTVSAPYETRDPQAYLQALQGILPVGGGDCPELTNTGLLAAINATAPGGEIYTFTDATAKDQYAVNSVITAAMQKDIRINYTLTGSCSPTDPGYIRSAAMTGGRIFRVLPAQISSLVDVVVPEMNGGRVMIFNRGGVAATGSPITIPMPVDSDMTELTVSLSVPENDVAATHTVVLKRPSGAPALPGDEGVTFTNVGINHIYRVKSPESGSWLVEISGSGPFTAQANGSSPIAFSNVSFVRPNEDIHGGFFSIDGYPVATVEALLAASLTGAPEGVTFSLASADGGSSINVDMVKDVPMADRDEYYGPVVLPAGSYRLAATGLDQNGAPFRRVFPTEFSAKSVEVTHDTGSPINAPAGGVVSVPFLIRNHGAEGSFYLQVEGTDGLSASGQQLSIGGNAEVAVAIQVSVPADVEVSGAGMVTVTATRVGDELDFNSASAIVDLKPPYESLQNGVPVSGLSSSDQPLIYRVPVTSGSSVLSLLTYGGSGNATLYAARGRVPTVNDHDAQSVRPGNNETIRVTSPTSGDWFISISPSSAFSNLSVRASW